MLAYASKGLIDLSAGSGEGCKAAMLLRKPCLAFCFSDAHVRFLFDHLVEWMLEQMTDSKSVYFNQNYAVYKKTGSGQAAGGTGKPRQDRPKRSRSADDKGTEGGKKGSKKRSRKTSSSSSSSDDGN